MKWILFKLALFYPRIYAFLCYHRKRKKRKEFEDKVVFFYQNEKDPRRVREIVRGIFELRGVRKVMRYLIPRMDINTLHRFAKIEGLNVVDRALKEGRGVLLMAGHIGIPHLAFNALRGMGYDIILLSGVTPKKPTHRRFRYYDTPENTIFVHHPSLSGEYKKSILETLRIGKIIYYDADAGEGRTKVTVPFLGREMDFPTGMVYLAHQANASIIPFIHLYQRGKMTLIFKDPLDEGWRDGESAYQRIVKEFVKLLESYILFHPEQYLGIYGPTVLAHYYQEHQQKDVFLEELEKRTPLRMAKSDDRLSDK